MAKISLRVYCQEIESLIDRGQNDEAIAHCKYVLKLFPKYIDAYRLLGKAYLENQHYSEAADIFQRVLSVIPDDFIAHIGLGITREDEGNLDAAIWHLERAFEVQPSNSAIQDEIRRLYGRRDGVQPSKVRLTRGALIRMYAQGELFSQAITETRSALADDPQRMDLEVILARLYYLAGQKIEATQLCSQIITKLPYCLEANKILSVILTETSRVEDAKRFQQRIFAVEPYSAFMNKSAPTVNQVPDAAILIERLDWQPSLQETKEPEWAKTVGVSLQGEETSLPEWLPSVSQIAIDPTEGKQINLAQSKINSESEKMEPHYSEAKEKEDIPDWMRTAGWQISDEETVEKFEQQNKPEDLGTDTLAEPGEIPGWLKSIAPASEIKIAADSRQMATPGVLAPENPVVGLEEPTLATETENDEMSQFFQDLAGTQEKSPVTSDIEINEQKEEKPFTFLETANAPVQEEKDVPDWLKGLEDADFSLETTSETPEVEQKAEEESLKPESIPPDLDSAMAWLETLAERQGADQETLFSRPEDRGETTPPEWISEHIDSLEGIAPKDEILETAPGEIKEEQELLPEGSPPKKEETNEADTWMETIVDQHVADHKTVPIIRSEQEEIPPAWIFPESEENEKSLPEGLEAAETKSPTSEDIEFDESFAWLEKLAAQQGNPEDALEPKTGVETSLPVETTNEAPAEIEAEHFTPANIEASQIEQAQPAAMEEVDSQNVYKKIENSLNKGNLQDAYQYYGELLQSKTSIDKTISSLQNALYAYPVDITLWQMLGDAFNHANHLQDALDAYTKAEELLQ